MGDALASHSREIFVGHIVPGTHARQVSVGLVFFTNVDEELMLRSADFLVDNKGSSDAERFPKEFDECNVEIHESLPLALVGCAQAGEPCPPRRAGIGELNSSLKLAAPGQGVVNLHLADQLVLGAEDRHGEPDVAIRARDLVSLLLAFVFFKLNVGYDDEKIRFGHLVKEAEIRKKIRLMGGDGHFRSPSA